MQHFHVLLSLSNICKFSPNCQHGARPAEWKVQRSKISFMLIFIQYPYSYFHQYFNCLKKNVHPVSSLASNCQHTAQPSDWNVQSVKNLFHTYFWQQQIVLVSGGHSHCFIIYISNYLNFWQDIKWGQTICFKIFSLVTRYSLMKSSNFWKYVHLWRNISFNLF